MALVAVAAGGSVLAAEAAAIKVIDPLPVMVLTGYSPASDFKAPGGVFIDRKRGDIWVADTGNHQIVGFDAKGIPLLKFRHMAIDPKTGEASPGSPVSLAVDSAGQMFVTDSVSDSVAVYNYRGRLIKRIDLAKILGVNRAKPKWLDMDNSDNLYIFDSERQVSVLDSVQQLVRTISLKRTLPRKDTAKGESSNAEELTEYFSAMDIGADGKICLINSVSDPCVRILDAKGEPLLSFGVLDIGGDFDLPVAVASIDDGTIWVADRGDHSVKQFAADGKFQQYIGGGPGSRPGEMRYPVAVATDGKEKLYVAERGTNRVQVFSLTK